MMRGAWRVFSRDVRRLARVPAAWIIVAGIAVTPSLYAWLNIVAFWDPYANTGSITVAVADLDEGASTELTGRVDVGAQIVVELEHDDQLDWRFMGEQEAIEAVRSGDAYAAIVIPREFSAQLLSITTGAFTQPRLEYFVNEKANAIAPKITDVAAGTLEEQITSSFVSTVADAAAEAIKDAGGDVELELADAKDATLAALEAATARLDAAREGVAGIQTTLADARSRLAGIRTTTGDVDATLAGLQTSLTRLQQLVGDVQTGIATFTDAATSAYAQTTLDLAHATAEASASLDALGERLTSAALSASTALASLADVAEANAAALDELQELIDQGGLDPAVAAQLTAAVTELEARAAADQQLLTDLQALAADLAATVDAVTAGADAVDQAMQETATSSEAIRTALVGALPGMTRATASLAASIGQLSASLGAQRTALAASGGLFDGIDAELVAAASAFSSLDATLVAAEDGIAQARTDVLALAGAAAVQRLAELTGLDPAQIAGFLADPVEVSEQVVYPIDSYGSAMAPLFMNLSLWIGAFVLMVIMRLEVDREGLGDITVRQAYLGRWLLFAALAVLQALVLSIGSLLIGVQHVNATAFVLTTVAIGLAYLSIIYALSVSFGYIGKGICVLLIIMQIPGASGLYPIELMPDFFRAIYPFLPFRYGIDALRETISGFYDGVYWRRLAELGIFVVLSFLLGLVLRRRLANLNRLFNRGLARTGLLASEEVEITDGGYQLADVIHALADREAYRRDIDRRATRFLAAYPRLRRVVAIVGVAGLVVIAIVSTLLPGGKAALLGVWVLWSLLVVAAVVTMEYVRSSLERAARLGGMNEAQLREELRAREAAGRS